MKIWILFGILVGVVWGWGDESVGRIVYWGEDGIIGMNTDGSGRSVLSDKNGTLSCSPDGSKILISPRSGFGPHLELVRADGMESTDLLVADICGGILPPFWLPNSIDFIYNTDVCLDTNSKMCIVCFGDIFGRKNIPVPSDRYKVLHAYFRGSDGGTISRDGRYIIYERFDNQRDIYIEEIETGEETKLTDGPLEKYEPAISPLNDRIAYAACKGQYRNCDIWSMNFDGSDPVNLTQDFSTSEGLPISSVSPAWSLDGSKIAFVGRIGFLGQERDVYIMDVDGSNKINLTNDPHTWKSDPCWITSPTFISTIVPPTSWGEIKENTER